MFADFMINAWISGTIVAVLAGLVGFFVVVRGSAFPAHAIPNGAFAGAAGASLIGVAPMVGMVSFAVASALGIGTLSRRTRSDVATALWLVSMLALGAAFLSQSTEYEPAVNALLFGEILGVSRSQLIPIAVVAVVCAVSIALMYRPLLLASTAPELAEARGVRNERLNVAFLLVIALATALTVPVVGALLTFSLMIGPAAAATTLARRPSAAMMLSVLFAVATLWAAIASSYLWDWPVGFFVGIYGLVVYLAARMRRASRTTLTPDPPAAHAH